MENQIRISNVPEIEHESTAGWVNDECGDSMWEPVLKEAELRSIGMDAVLDLWFRF